MSETRWVCPHCGSTDLQVSVQAWATLTQYSDNIVTEASGDEEWDSDSTMNCLECNLAEPASSFQVEMSVWKAARQAEQEEADEMEEEHP